MARLRSLVKHQYKIDERKENKKRLIKGGNPALLSVGLPIIGTLASEIVKDLYGLLKRKIFGGEINHKRIKSQKEFVKHFVNKL